MAVFDHPTTLREVARVVDGQLIGDPELELQGLRTLPHAAGVDLSFVTDAKYLSAAKESSAGALLIGADLPQAELAPNLVLVQQPATALATLLDALFPEPNVNPGIHPTAVIGEGCDIHDRVEVGPFCVIGPNCRLDAGVRLLARVTVGDGCEIGAGSVLHPGVVLYPRVKMGERCQIHGGAVLGSDGFGYTSHGSESSMPTKMRQVGRLILGNDVEVGANSAIDRALLEETRIGHSTKIDNLVQVGHNVIVGDGCLLCGQAGVAGSAVLGDQVVLAGQAGVSGHLSIGDRTQVAAKSAVLQGTASDQKLAGIPAGPIRNWQREGIATRKLPELLRRVARLERANADKEDE